MKSALTVVLFRLFTIGVFVDGKEASHVLVIEGDSVTLKPGFTDVHKNDRIEWRFKGIRIDKFVDGLQRDSKTGDLKISNIRTTDSGLYKVKISSTSGSSEMEFNVTVVSADEVKTVSVMEGDSVTLRTDVPDIQRVDVIRWRFGKQKSLVAEINRMADIFNKLDGPDERFRDRLELDHQTGSLIITDIRTQHAGLYEAEISNTRSRYTIHYTQSFSVTGRVVESVSVLEGDSVTLHTGLTGIQRDDKIRWKFGDQDIARLKTWRNIDMNNQTRDLSISNIQRNQSGHYKVEIITRRMILHRKYQITIDDVKSVSVLEGDSVTLRTGLTGIQIIEQIMWKFEDQDIADLKTWRNIDPNSMTGDLNISNIQRDQSGHYKVEIITRRMILHRKYQIAIGEMKTVSVKEGASVSLQIVTEIQSDDLIYWMFGNITLAEFNKTEPRFNVYNGPDKRFRGKLDLDHQTGSLNITNTRTTGDYELKIISSRHTINRRITVTVSDAGLSPGAVAGIVVAVVGLLAAAVVAGFVCYRRKNSEPERQRENGVNLNTQKTDDPATEETKLPTDP